MKNDIFTVVELPRGRKAVETKWLYRWKNEHGHVSGRKPDSLPLGTSGWKPS